MAKAQPINTTAKRRSDLELDRDSYAWTNDCEQRADGTPMTPAELSAAGGLPYGRRWKLPLARAVGYAREALHHYSTGGRRIPSLLAARIRAIVNIGPAGTAIRRSIKNSMPEIPTFTAHRVARQIVLDLTALGLLAENSSGDIGRSQLEPTGNEVEPGSIPSRGSGSRGSMAGGSDQPR
jgi:hypothetical protein